MKYKKIGIFFSFIFVFFIFSQKIYPSFFSEYKIEKITLRFLNKINKRDKHFRSLLSISKDDHYNLSKIRKSIENLYKTGQFKTIEVNVVENKGKKLELIFILYYKFKIRSVKVLQKNNSNNINILDSVFSLRKNTFFNRDKIPDAINEIKISLKSNGFEHPKIEYKTVENIDKGTIDILFNVQKGKVTKINKINIEIDDKILKKKISSFFNFSRHIQKKIQTAVNKTKELLKKKKYFFPEIKVKTTYINKEKEVIDINVKIIPGYKYLFRFMGMKKKMSVISTAWKNKVFEKWAEKESVTRLLNYLYTKGYLKATIRSEILRYKDKIKTIVFYVDKGEKYYLGKVSFIGNEAISDKRIREVINSDRILHNKLFGFNIESILVDVHVLKLLYLNKGYKFINIEIDKKFYKNKVDLNLVINEGEKNIIDSIIFSGNKSFSSNILSKDFKSKINGPFIRNIFKRDIESIKNFYLKKGYKDAVVNYEVSKGSFKSILVSINEGESYKLSELIIIGATKAQKHLLKDRFPVKDNNIYDISEVEKFKNEIENSGIFNSFDYSEIKKENNYLDIIIKVIPERSKYYGFGLGWDEDNKNIRGTVEYQVQNIFNSYSTFSTTLQLGLKEIKGAVNYDTPYLFNTEINSSMRLWMEDEIFPSYKATRYGFSESIIKKLNQGSYISAAYMWYRTNITEKFGDSSLTENFSTNAISLLYVIENRNNPFNPTSGEFFSTSLKVAFPLFCETVFYKFFWNYQNNWKFLKSGVLSFSIRNGFAAGDMHISERFFAGGTHTFRGTPNDRLGPINTDYDEPRGGNAMILMNLEATFPLSIFPIDNLYYSIFFDVGNIYWDAKDFNIEKVERAIGIGLKYKTPMGPLKIEVAWNLRGHKADRFFNFTIGIGNVF